MIIAIDGPAASGKSTTAKHVAEQLNYLYIDTGAMYRAATWLMLENNIDVENEAEVLSELVNHTIRQENLQNTTKTFVDNKDVSDDIRSRIVTNGVSKIASYSTIRERLVLLQQEMGASGNVVLDGRDIGTVVFPNAELKVFMVATVEERAKRRLKELSEKGEQINLSQLIKEIELRDHLDATREASPLKKAKDAVEIDTSLKTINEQVNEIINYIELKKG